MRADLSERTSDVPEDAADILSAVVLYEDFTTAVRAMRLLARVCREGEKRLPMNAEVWNFIVLGIEPYRRAALESAWSADLMVVAAHAADPLPGEVESWLDTWASSDRGEEVALIGLLDGNSAEVPSSVQLVLASAARRAGANLFACNVGDSDPPPANRLSQCSVGVKHWGINE